MSKAQAVYTALVTPLIAVVLVVSVLAATPVQPVLAAPPMAEIDSPIRASTFQTSTAAPLELGFTVVDILNSAGQYVTWAGAAITLIIGLVAGRSTVERLLAWIRTAFS
jgi:hypothetical protein